MLHIKELTLTSEMYTHSQLTSVQPPPIDFTQIPAFSLLGLSIFHKCWSSVSHKQIKSDSYDVYEHNNHIKSVGHEKG